MIDGLYKISFSTQLGNGTGVVVVASNKVMGGDAAMYYVGEIEHNGTNIYGKIRIHKHSTPQGITSIFGKDDITLTIKGKSTTNSFASFSGIAAEAPDKVLSAEITLLEAS